MAIELQAIDFTGLFSGLNSLQQVVENQGSCWLVETR